MQHLHRVLVETMALPADRSARRTCPLAAVAAVVAVQLVLVVGRRRRQC